MVALLLKDKTGIFKETSVLVEKCGIVSIKNIYSGEYCALQQKIFNHYSTETLYAMDIECSGDIRLNRLYCV